MRDKLQRGMFVQYESQSCVEDTEALERYMIEYVTKQIDMFGGQDKCLKHVKLHQCCNLCVQDPEKTSTVAVTIHPFHESPTPMSYEQWLHVMHKAKNQAKMLVYLRSNLVKWAISHVAVKEQLRVCNTHKVKVGSKCLKQLNSTLTIRPKSLRAKVKTMYDLTVALLALGRQLAAHMQGAALVVTYEELQLDYMQVLRRVGLLVDFGDVFPSDRLKEDDEKYAKRGNDDLRTYLANFDEIEEDFRRFPCFHEQLLAVEPKNFKLCDMPDDFSPSNNDDSHKHAYDGFFSSLPGPSPQDSKATDGADDDDDQLLMQAEKQVGITHAAPHRRQQSRRTSMFASNTFISMFVCLFASVAFAIFKIYKR